MKKKLMFFVLATVLFCLVMIMSIYVVISNYEYSENVKKDLKLSNDIIANLIESSDINLEEGTLPFSEAFSKANYRFTIINKYGNVIYDSSADRSSMENHNNREEIIQARKKGDGISLRYSRTLRKNMLYVAKKIKGDYVLRSSVDVAFIGLIHTKYIEYYIVIILLVIAMTLLVSSKLSLIIIKPIKDLEYVTGRIARGELDKRVNVLSDDEIGQLGNTFNFMADKLQNTVKESLERENKLEAILKSMDSGIIAVDKNSKIIMINPYAQKIFGIKSDSLGKKLIDHIRDFEIENAINRKVDDYIEIKIFWPSEKILRIRTADIVSGNDHIGTVAAVQDITDFRKLENMRTEFVANVSHELKTPLTSIKGFAETLRYVDDKENKERFLNIINDEAERLTRLINDILILSDLEMHKEDKKDIVDVNEVVYQVYCLMKNTAESKKIDIEIVDGKIDPFLGNTDKFKQMLINLVDNAIKYSEAKDKVTIGTKMEEGECVIWVEDTGVGIPKEHIPRLFERFYRVDKARSRAKGGTGLGLAIVKHIVIGFNGTIDVQSEVGKGSKFTVKLPVNAKETYNNV